MSFDSTEKERAMDVCILILFFIIYSPSSPTQGLTQQLKRVLLCHITIKITPDIFQVINFIKATLHRCAWRLRLTVAQQTMGQQHGMVVSIVSIHNSWVIQGYRVPTLTQVLSTSLQETESQLLCTSSHKTHLPLSYCHFLPINLIAYIGKVFAQRSQRVTPVNMKKSCKVNSACFMSLMMPRICLFWYHLYLSCSFHLGVSGLRTEIER